MPKITWRKSCYAEDISHGMAGTKTYNSWYGMLKRCYDPKDKDYQRYGGAGIKVCESWWAFSVFYKDMGERPPGNSSIDRINGKNGYSKSNCRWLLSAKEQNRNRVDNRVIAGKCVSAWSEETGTATSTIYNRLGRGWGEELAVSAPSSPINTKYTHQGKTMTIPEWSVFLGVSPYTLYSRIKHGYSLDIVFNNNRVVRKNAKFLTVNGITKTLQEWEQMTGVPYQTLYNRIMRGKLPEEVIAKTSRRNNEL